MKTKAKRDEIERAFTSASNIRAGCKASYLDDPTDDAWDAVIAADVVYAVAWSNRDAAMGFVRGIK